ncbi:indole-3-glycerol phosphate synthase TrpC [Bacillus solimangrovi]|uniref:Indole-3-glycerol phosphate synthase n=1 Tax=Bacillus solimangrovi TaxID=1305675 RepID=A0A1E5LH96_9BACI|nr:indole-3-glycerol phosphate synthase TrpC [Bacillus solimangrovi]OEH93447.1 indole-3-glycerol phosphate synthase [Bacillus solimangrovi]
MLDRIHETKKEEVARIKMPDMIEIPRYSFYEALKKPNRSLALIAEVKKASPSKGIIRENFHPEMIATAYREANADAISVLTDEMYFKGKREYLPIVKKKAERPVLRKDFIIDEIQIEESIRLGADAILLITEMIGAEKLEEFYHLASEKGLDCVVEVHDSQALESVLKRFTPKIVGINNRNLKTFETSLSHTESIAKLVPNESIFISESGIHSSEDLLRVKKAGAQGILIGEGFMRHDDVAGAVQSMFAGFEREHIR